MVRADHAVKTVPRPQLGHEGGRPRIGSSIHCPGTCHPALLSQGLIRPMVSLLEDQQSDGCRKTCGRGAKRTKILGMGCSTPKLASQVGNPYCRSLLLDSGGFYSNDVREAQPILKTIEK